ncbi:hypothetical protein U1Q18_040457, partial [Sarracenia purpurea var. burkii]
MFNVPEVGVNPILGSGAKASRDEKVLDVAHVLAKNAVMVSEDASRGNPPTSRSSQSQEAGTVRREGFSPISRAQSVEGQQEDEDDQEGLDPDRDIVDLVVKSAAFEVDIAKQSLKNALDVQAHHQAQERVV